MKAIRSKPSIALIGLRGCGKSTVGRELARLLGGAWIDTDDLIAEDAGKSIATIFAAEGETGFRRRERIAIERAVAARPAVISVGGGAILDETNVKELQTIATVVWLTAEPPLLWQRLIADESTPVSRPSLTDRSGQAELELLLTQRAARYEHAADLTIDTSQLSPDGVARTIMARLKRPDANGFV